MREDGLAKTKEQVSLDRHSCQEKNINVCRDRESMRREG